MSRFTSKNTTPLPNKLSSETLLDMIDSISEDDALLFLKKTPAWLHNGIEIFAATQRMKSRLVRELARRIQSQCSGKTKTPLDWRSDLGITALMAAAGQGPAGTDSVLALLEHGADPSLFQIESPASFWRGGAFRKPARGFSSMDFAASSNACRSISSLAQAAPELISTPGSGGLLPIARAAKKGNVGAIRLLKANDSAGAAGVDNSGFGPVETCAMREGGPAYALATVAKWIDPRRPIMPKACHAVSGLAQIIPNSSTLARLAGRDSAADILDAVALGWESGVYPPTRPLPALPPVREASAAVEPSHVLPEGPLSAESSIDNSRALKESARIALMKMSKASSESKVARKSMTARSSTRMPR